MEAEAAVVKVEVASAAKVKAPAPLFGGFFTPKSAPSTPAPEVEKVSTSLKVWTPSADAFLDSCYWANMLNCLYYKCDW